MYHTVSIRHKQTGVLFVTAIILLTIAGCSSSEKKQRPVIEQHIKPDYTTVPVQLMNPAYEISLPANLEPYEQVAVHAKVQGFVQKIFADRGSYVRKGQLLAILEAPEINQKYLSDKSSEQKVYSDYVYAKQAYDRLTEASATAGSVAAIELERAKSIMESAKSAYEASKAGTQGTAQLQNYLRITSPFDGVVTERNISEGALTGAGTTQALFKIAQGNKLRLVLAVPEKHAASIQKNTKATFTVSARPGKIFNTMLSRTSVLLDQQDRSLTLEFDVDNHSGELQGGDYAQVNLKLQRQSPSCWVPRNCVLNTQTGTFVLTLKNENVKRIAVKEGIRTDTHTEIFGEISDHDQVIVNPTEEMKTSS
ncbi:efflux RND transporter periplasmic adaptor subunit [Terrimonas sp.]|uniref:efflux RND transporter periplasmic adaptor subunit n=1 Tax=Terrimonas sp. TaxID=1914338 RepID=UPI000D5237B6|nr:efflux RND transporter periplasmic adaptor subunit [Terrimonas sp.]PVD51506.1 efflux RND transporter periplasmic adaptor subunit [Terrimonas sp.]